MATEGTPIKHHPVPQRTPEWGGDDWKRANRALLHAFYYRLLSRRQPELPHQLYSGSSIQPTVNAYGMPLLRMTLDYHDNEWKMSAIHGGESGGNCEGYGGPSKMDVSPVKGNYKIHLRERA